MEKRFALFLALSLGILVGYSALLHFLAPPRPVVVEQSPAQEAPADQAPVPPESPPQATPAEPAESDTPQPAAVATADAAMVPQQWSSLGSYAPSSGASLLVTFNNQGAGIERVELTARDEKGRLRYLQLDDRTGYLGHLALTPYRSQGCVVNVVGSGTPAALAGVRVGDVLLAIDEHPLDVPEHLSQYLQTKKPGDSVRLAVQRRTAEASQNINLGATLDYQPLSLIRPEPLYEGESPHPLSFLVSLVEQSGENSIATNVPRRVNWKVVREAEGVIEFSLTLNPTAAAELGLPGPVELVKRYRLGAATDVPPAAGSPSGYHVDLEVGIRNLLDQPRRVQFKLTGPNGLPTEGWWYSTKIHTSMFGGAGARDVISQTRGEWVLVGCPELYKLARKDGDDTSRTLFAEGDDAADRTLDYLAVDTQYFAAALVPQSESGNDGVLFQRGEAFAIGDVNRQPKGFSRTTNVGFELISEPFELDALGEHRQKFRLFLGPKDPSLLQAYGLNSVLYYGWFGGISKVLANILHFFYGLVGNYGIAIVMLTVLVRGCMFPISRKAATNAAMMQELAPEMRKIAEKYKNDMEKRSKAQQELFRKHNYNPFGGCWLMFLQLPIFLGLYRALAVDLNLRQAALIPGVDWASNLGGPDQLLNWERFLPSFLASETGMLGPYLNILPLITVALFLVHQQLFTPPATDENSRMQLQMMKYMTVFMGFLFFKVPAGLCIYFIASSIWGIAERLLVPKPKVNLKTVEAAPSDRGRRSVPWNGSNGGSEKRPARKRHKRP